MILLRTVFLATSRKLVVLPAILALLLHTYCTRDSVNSSGAQGQSLITVSSPQNQSVPSEASFSFLTTPPAFARTFIPYEYQPALEESDVAVTWSLEDAPAGMTINEAGGFVRWTPSDEQGGSEITTTIIATASSDPSLTGIQELTISIESQWWNCDPSETLPDFEFLAPSAGDTFYVGDTVHLQICVRNDDISLAQASVFFSPDLGVTQANILNSHRADKYFIDHHWIWVITDTVGDAFTSFPAVSDKCTFRVAQYSVPQNSATSGIFTIAQRSSSVSARRRTLRLQ